MKLLVIETLHIRIDSADNIEDHSDDDNESRTWDEEIKSWGSGEIEELKLGIEFRDGIGEYRNNREESTSEEVEMIWYLLKVGSGLLSRTNAWDITTSFLDTFSDFGRIECDRHVEIGESENEDKVHSDIEPRRVLEREIRRKPWSDVPPLSTATRKDLTDERWEGDEGHGEDDRHHPGLIDLDREVRFFFSPRSSIDERNLSESLSKSYDNINDSDRQEREENKWAIRSRTQVPEDMLRHTCQYSCEDDNRTSVSDTSFCDKITKPEEDHSPCRDHNHRWEYHSPEVCRIDDRNSGRTRSDETIEEKNHPVALRESERKGEVSSIIIELLLTLFSFFFEGFERRNDNRKELDNNCRIDIRGKSHENYRELFETTSHEWTKESKLRIRLKLRRKSREQGDIHPWDWDGWKELVDRDYTESYKDLASDMWSLPNSSSLSNHSGKLTWGHCIEKLRKTKWKAK